MKKIFCSGCFDLLHSGHVAFFEEAAALGDLYVGIGSDRTVFELKGRRPVTLQDERLYMVRSVRHVKDAWINSGSGLLDFLPEIRRLRPDVLFVNEDGNNEAKREFCAELGMEYRVSSRIPHAGLPARSTTAWREECRIPYRIDLAGGWLDQPVVSKLHPGAVLTISIEPDYEFNDLAGMATSTRKKAIELWQTKLPPGDPVSHARTLFCVENQPGKREISGSQDSLGIVLPGLNRLEYDGDYWPRAISSVLDDGILSWLESHLSLTFIQQRGSGFDVYANANLTAPNAKALSVAADACWDAIQRRDFDGFAKAFTDSFHAQTALFPSMLTDDVARTIEAYRHCCRGWKLCGAGGGGYMAFWSREREKDMMPIRIRRAGA